MRALLAEDDAGTRMLLKRILERAGHTVTAVPSGTQAWEAYERHGHLLVLLDWSMAGLSGIEVCRRIRASSGGRRSYVVFVTSRSQQEDLKTALAAGADDYIVKPVRDEELAMRLRFAEMRIKERLETYEKLASFEDLLEGSGELIQTARADGRLVFVNPTWSATMGIPPDDANRLSIFELVTREHRPAFEYAFNRALEGETVNDVQTMLVARDGRHLPVEGTLRPRHRGQGGGAVRMIFRDVSRRKRAERALRTIIDGTSRHTGEQFFRSLTRHLCQALDARAGILMAYDERDPHRARSLAAWDGTTHTDTRFFELSEPALGGAAPVPRRELLADYDATTYLGVPIRSEQGDPLGALAVLLGASATASPEGLRLLEIFAQRAGAEVERLRALRMLERRERLMMSLAEVERLLLAWSGKWEDLVVLLEHVGLTAEAIRTRVLAISRPNGALCAEVTAMWQSELAPCDSPPPRGESVPMEDYIGERVKLLIEGEILRVRQGEGTVLLQEHMRQAQANEVVVAPVSGSRGLIALLSLHVGSQEIAADPALVDYLRSIATALALAIDRRETAERLQGIVGSLQEVVWSISATDLKRLYVNEAVEEVTGYTAERFYEPGDLWRDIVAPDDRVMLDDMVEQVLRRGEGRAEYRIVRTDGTIRWLEDRGRLTRDARGTPIRIDGIALDITKRKEAQSKAYDFSTLGQRLNWATTAEQAARVVFTVADRLVGWDACWMDLCDEEDCGKLLPILYMDEVNGVRVECTPEISDWTGCQTAERTLKEGGILVADRDAEPSIELAPFGDTQRRSRSMIFVPIETAKASVGVLSIQSYEPNRYGPEEFVTMKAIGDFCAGALLRTRAQESQMRAELRREAVLKAMPDLLFRVAADGRYLEWHAQDESLLSAPLERFEAGRTIQETFPPDTCALVETAIRRALEGEGVQRIEYELPVRAGARAFEANIAPCADDEVIMVTRDITERRLAEEKRLQIERHIREGQRLESLGVLAGGIAHDFNNLLTSILGYASLGRARAGEEETLGSYFTDIEASAKSAAELAMLMLAYSGKGQFVVELLDLRETILSIEGLLRQELLQLKGELKFELEADVPQIEGDVAQIRQVILNLVLNGAQAMDSIGGGTITVRLRHEHVTADRLQRAHNGRELPPGKYVSMQIVDEGHGMDPETLGRIFDPFFTTKHTGRGLGLAAVLGIVRGHRGALDVTSQPSLGTMFTIWLPPSKEEASGARPDEGDLMLSSGAEGLVLVVDDEKGVRRLAKEILEMGGYQVETAADGIEAIEQCKRFGERIQAVLLDLTMPRMNGVDAFRELRKLRPDLRVIVSSGYSEQEAFQRFKDDVPNAFMQKPYSAIRLLRQFEQMVPRAGTRV